MRNNCTGCDERRKNCLFSAPLEMTVELPITAPLEMTTEFIQYCIQKRSLPCHFEKRFVLVISSGAEK
jgi:hypothetical protein